MILWVVVACTPAGEPTAVPATPLIDETTGLALNPVVIPDGEFVVQGRWFGR